MVGMLRGSLTRGGGGTVVGMLRGSLTRGGGGHSGRNVKG